jgi:hypothetical protein
LRKKLLMVSLLISSMLFAVAAAVASPVMAQTPKKIPVTVTVPIDSFVFIPPEKSWMTDGLTVHNRGIGWMLTYIIQDTATNGEVINLVGAFESSLSDNWNSNVGAFRFDAKITLPGGTFEGNHIAKSHDIVLVDGVPTPMGTSARAVLHGTGVYQGWQFTYSMDNYDFTEAYIMIP